METMATMATMETMATSTTPAALHSDTTTPPKITTGCGILLVMPTATGVQVNICEENRVALTKQEQQNIGGQQPYMLPDITLNHMGEPIDALELGRWIHMRKNASATDEQARVAHANARKNHDAFSNNGRHFLHIVLRERKKTDETDKAVVVRLLKEEYNRMFTIDVPEPDFLYRREGSKTYQCMYIVHVESTQILSITRKSNYFCPKALPELCNNDYYETRNHRFMELNDARLELVEYERAHPGHLFDMR